MSHLVVSAQILSLTNGKFYNSTELCSRTRERGEKARKGGEEWPVNWADDPDGSRI